MERHFDGLGIQLHIQEHKYVASQPFPYTPIVPLCCYLILSPPPHPKPHSLWKYNSYCSLLILLLLLSYYHQSVSQTRCVSFNILSHFISLICVYFIFLIRGGGWGGAVWIFSTFLTSFPEYLMISLSCPRNLDSLIYHFL